MRASASIDRRQPPARRLSGLFWSAKSDLVTGQSIVSDHVLENIPDISWTDSRYANTGVTALFSVIFRYLFVYIRLVVSRPDFHYLVCSRSLFGFLRDAPILVTSRLGQPTLVHVHGSDITALFDRPVIGAIARFCYRHTTIIIPSQHLVEPLLERGLLQLSVIENFAAKPATKPSIQNLEDRSLSVLWNSNIMASKGIRELAIGVEKAISLGANLNFTVIGKLIPDDEASLPELQRFVDDLASKPWVHFHGPVSHETALSLLDDADIVALPSQYSSECQPRAIIPAMCLGKAIIVTETPALRATIGDDTAILAPRNGDELAMALQSLALDRFQTDRQNAAAQHAIQRFSIEKFEMSLLKVFRSAMRPKHGFKPERS